MRCFSCAFLLSLPALATAGGLVWSDRPSGTKSIRACNFDGSNVRNLYTVAGDPRGVIIDAIGDRVYFTDQFSATATSGEINSIPINGGAREQNLLSLNRPADLRFDAGNRILYWREETGGTICRALLPISGGPLSAQTLFSGPKGVGTPDGAIYTTGQNMRGVCVDSVGGMIY